MKQECLLCERTSPDSNLYCQETYCPAEMSPTILDYGDWLGNIEIVRPVIVLRSSVLYEARCQKKKVLLKVAHPGPENSDKLKREAQFLQKLRREKAPSEYFPVWLPPYSNASYTDEYGKVVLKGQLLYYSLFEYFDGEPLRAILAKSPQLWIYDIGWIMVGLASAVAVLQSKGLFHFALSPDTLLVRYDDSSGAPSILLFDLGVISDREGLAWDWLPFFVPPAYTAPELIGASQPRADYATDVYGLGLVLYELLVGQPTFPFKLYSDDEVYSAVRHNRRVPMTRTDVTMVAEIAVRAIEPDPAVRYADAREMVEKLHKAFGTVPEKKRPVRAVVGVLIVVALLSIVLLLLAAGK